MKRFIFLLSFFAILLNSCSQLNNPKTNIRIQLPSARAIDRAADDQTVYDVEISLTIGDTVQTQTGKISSLSESTFTFNDIEIGASAVALCKIILDNIIIWQGESEKVTITEDINISIGMKSLIFTQETFRALMPDYKTNKSSTFEIPEGYTKIVGKQNPKESVFEGWQSLSTSGSLKIIIPASVAYIDENAFYDLQNSYTYFDFKDPAGWTHYYTENGVEKYDIIPKNQLSEFMPRIIQDGGYLRKLPAVDMDFPFDGDSFDIASYNASDVTIGDKVNFNLEDLDYSQPHTYQWYIDGVPVAGATESTFEWDTTGYTSGTYQIMCIVDGKTSGTYGGVGIGINTTR